MSLRDSSQWKEWAREWSFVHSPQKVMSYPNEWMAGMRDHRLVKMSWGGEKGQRLSVVIRFPRVSSAETLHESLRQSESLAELPGWKKIKPLRTEKPRAAGVEVPKPGAQLDRPKIQWTGAQPDLVVDEGAMVWSRTFVWRRPKPEQLRRWVERLLAAVSQLTPAFDDRCELCNLGHVSGFLLYEGVPMLVCPSCKERIAAEGQRAEELYEQEYANYTLGILYAVGAAVVGAVAWAALAVGSGRMFVAAALGIGWLVAFCYKLGARKLDRLGQGIGVVLTIVSAVFGEVLLYAWQIKQERPDIGFRLDAGLWGFGEMLKSAPGEIILSVVFGAVGAIVAAGWLRRPRFVPRLESPEEAAEKKKKAA